MIREIAHLRKICIFSKFYVELWLILIRMQNNYELQNVFFLVFSLARTRTTFSPLPQVAVYCVNQLNRL